MVNNTKEYAKKYYWEKYRNLKTLKDKVKRQQARRLMEKKWLVKKWDWKEVDHIKWVRVWNSMKNLRIIPKILNRKLGQKKWVKNRLSNNK